MKIDKGIEILEVENRCPWNHAGSDLRDAVKLGIEALKRVKQERTGYERYAPDLLPGETGDTQDPQPTPSAAPHEPLTWGGAWADAKASLNT